MSNTKTAEQAMQYELTGSKKLDGKAIAVSMAEKLSTARLVWLLVKRHKVALLAIGNVVLVLNWAIPEWPQIVRSLF